MKFEKKEKKIIEIVSFYIFRVKWLFFLNELFHLYESNMNV